MTAELLTNKGTHAHKQPLRTAWSGTQRVGLASRLSLKIKERMRTSNLSTYRVVWHPEGGSGLALVHSLPADLTGG